MGNKIWRNAINLWKKSKIVNRKNEIRMWKINKRYSISSNKINGRFDTKVYKNGLINRKVKIICNKRNKNINVNQNNNKVKIIRIVKIKNENETCLVNPKNGEKTVANYNSIW